MARCPDCNKFVSFDSDTEPEVGNLEISDDGCTITSDFHITNNCADCGTELREATLEVDTDCTSELEALLKEKGITVPENATLPEGFTVEVSDDGGERYQRTVGKGRGATTFYGGRINATVTVSNAEDIEVGSFTVTLEDEVQASSMDECC